MNTILYLFFLITELFILIGVSIYGIGLLFSAFKGAPYVPTSKKQLAHIFKNLKLKKGEQFIELGSGDGRIVRYAVKEFGVDGVGVEINPLLVWWSRFLARRDNSASKALFVKKNIFDYSLRNADYLYIFLMPELIVKLLPKFKQELKKGTVVISHGFKIIGYEKKLFYTEKEKTFSTFYYKV
jgi:ribosomal protein L11 methylase PrmA